MEMCGKGRQGRIRFKKHGIRQPPDDRKTAELETPDGKPFDPVLFEIPKDFEVKPAANFKRPGRDSSKQEMSGDARRASRRF